MMKNIITILTITIITIFSSYGQDGGIKGEIKSESSEAIPYVTVSIKKITKGTISNDLGRYEIKNLEPGSYTLQASSVGFEAVFKTVSVSSGKIATVDFVLKESKTLLQEVEIIGRKAKTYKNNVSFAATKTATKLKDVPQAVSYVTKEIFADQQAYRINDVVKNISGVNQFSYYDDFSMRGFRSGNTYINGLRAVDLFGPQPLLVNIERLEVLKGPASAMFGNANPGGTMNRVTKKPLAEDRKAVSFTTGSFNTFRTTLDFTGPMNESKTLLYRLNVGYENSDSFRDLQESKSYVVAPSISFLPTEKTRINFDLVIQNFNGKLDRGQPIYGATAGTSLTSKGNTPINFAIGATNDYHKSDANYFTLSLNHKFSDNLSFNSSFMRFVNQEDLFEHRTSNKYAVDALGNEIPTLMGMRISARQQKKIAENVNNYFVYNVKTANVSHKLLLGLDYMQRVTPVGGARIWTSGGKAYLKKDGTVGKYDPANIGEFNVDSNGNPIPNIPHFDLENPSYKLAYPNDYILGSSSIEEQKYTSVGYYLQDQIKWGKLQVLLGGRYNKFTEYLNYNTPKEENVTYTKFIPRAGVVYSATDNVNVYGTYTESFEPQSSRVVGGKTNGPFDPLVASMVELGIKAAFLNNKLEANLAVYKILQENELVTDPSDDLRLLQLGETSSKGVELDVVGRVSHNFSVTANYAFNISKFETTPADSYFKKGEMRPNAPKHQGGFFAKYKFTNKTLKGIAINAGSNFVSERNSAKGAALKFPSYVVSDVGASYEVDKFVMRLTVNNVFDKTHWVGGYSYNRMFPGAPRNYLLSVGYTF